MVEWPPVSNGSRYSWRRGAAGFALGCFFFVSDDLVGLVARVERGLGEGGGAVLGVARRGETREKNECRLTGPAFALAARDDFAGCPPCEAESLLVVRARLASPSFVLSC